MSTPSIKFYFCASVEQRRIIASTTTDREHNASQKVEFRDTNPEHLVTDSNTATLTQAGHEACRINEDVTREAFREIATFDGKRHCRVSDNVSKIRIKLFYHFYHLICFDADVAYFFSYYYATCHSMRRAHGWVARRK